jgi:outer membrane protein TolC
MKTIWLKGTAAFAITFALGCATAPPEHDTAAQIQSAASLANAITFHTDALPAEAAPAADTLPLPAAIERALRQSPEVQVALANVRTAQADAHQTRLFSNPVLDIAFRFSNPDDFEAVSRTAPSPFGSGSVSFTSVYKNVRNTFIEAGLSTELVKILQRPRRISAADASLRGTSAKAITTTLDVIHQTQQHFFDAVGLRRETEILTERTNRIGQLLKVAEARLAAGEGTQLDVATLKAEQSTAAIDLREASLKLSQANIALAHRIGQPRGRIDWHLSTPLITQITLRGESDAIAHGLRARPEIQADRWQLTALEDQSALARLAWLEGAAAGLVAEHEESEFEGTGGLSRGFTSSDDWSLGPSLALPLPIFDWGQAKRAKARAQAIAARQRLTQTTRQVAREIRQAHHAAAQLMTTASRARTDLVPLHEERVRLARVVFDAGQEDVTNLRLAELDLLEAQLKLLRLDHRTTLAIIALYRATGGNKEEKPNDQSPITKD